MPLTDFHCHYFPSPDEEITVLYNSVIPEDWAQIPEQKNVVPFWGIHPWYASFSRYDPAVFDMLVSGIRAGKVKGIGETGLDRTGKNRDIEGQSSFFKKHLEIAEKFKLPVAVHCVRNHGLAAEMIMELGRDIPVMMHFFSGSKEIADILLERNTWFSFPAAIIRPEYKNMMEVFKYIPAERIFVETDLIYEETEYKNNDNFMMRRKKILAETYKIAAETKNFSEEDFEARMGINLKNFISA